MRFEVRWDSGLKAHGQVSNENSRVPSVAKTEEKRFQKATFFVPSFRKILSS